MDRVNGPYDTSAREKRADNNESKIWPFLNFKNQNGAVTDFLLTFFNSNLKRKKEVELLKKKTVICESFLS